jgi:hypothetical protein
MLRAHKVFYSHVSGEPTSLIILDGETTIRFGALLIRLTEGL